MERDNKGRFIKGHGGRPKGSKNALSKLFIDKLYADFKEHGEQVLEDLRSTQPGVYARVVAMLVPKDIDVTHQGSVSVREVKVAFMDKLIDTHDISDDVDQDDEHVTH